MDSKGDIQKKHTATTIGIAQTDDDLKPATDAWVATDQGSGVCHVIVQTRRLLLYPRRARNLRRAVSQNRSGCGIGLFIAFAHSETRVSRASAKHMSKRATQQRTNSPESRPKATAKSMSPVSRYSSGKCTWYAMAPMITNSAGCPRQ